MRAKTPAIAAVLVAVAAGTATADIGQTASVQAAKPNGGEAGRPNVVLIYCDAQTPIGFGIILEGADCVVESAYVSCAGPYGIRIAGPGGHQILNTHVDLETKWL